MVQQEDVRARRPVRNAPPVRHLGGARRGPAPSRSVVVVVVAVVVIVALAVALWSVVSRGSDDVATSPSSTAPEPVAIAAPRLSIPAEIAPSTPGFVSRLRGLVDGASSLTADGQPVPLEPGGAFSVLLPQGVSQVQLTATGDGGTTAATVAVTATPAPSAYPMTAAVHVRAGEWADPVVRQQVLDLIAAGRINAVELDIKDEAGEVGYASQVPLAATVGAVRAHYDAAAVTAELHGLGVRVIGRVVCFLDPVLAGWAWANGRPDMVVLDGAGTTPLDNDYGSAAFTNVASVDVRQYQIDLANEAVALGFDEILYDYVRRPEGDMATMQFIGLDSSPEVSVARFVAASAAALAPTGARLGVSVFGIAATRPEAIGQDIGLLAPSVDYVAPMVYPSHWGPGEYGVADPVREPAAIVAASLADFRRITAGSGAAVVPWLQDFSTADVPYGVPEVAAQIDATMASGASGYLLWNPASTYHVEALPPRP